MSDTNHKTDQALLLQLEKSPVSLQFFLEFVRQLVRETVSHDVFALAVLAAVERTGVSYDEARTLLRAVLAEKEQCGVWPKGF